MRLSDYSVRPSIISIRDHLSTLAKELLAARHVDHCADVHEDAELVIGDRAIWQPLGNVLHEWKQHITAGGMHCASLKAVQLLGEILVKCLLLSLRSKP